MARRDDYTIWEEKFQPIMNEDDGSLRLFHWGHEDLEYLQNIKTTKGVEYIWTMIDCDGKLYFSPGIHIVNRMDYIVCKNPWNEKTRDYKY